jgi:hypothetical protein
MTRDAGKHTPLPWRFIGGADNTETDKGLRCGTIVCDHENTGAYHVARIWNDANRVNGPANAALIVRAVNAHEVLVKALQEARTVLEFCDHPSGQGTALDTIRAGKPIKHIIDAALKLSEGTE